MIRVGVNVHQAIYCPTCGMDVRIFKGDGTPTPTVVCRNARCVDSSILFQINRESGKIVAVWLKEATDAELGKTT